MPTLEIESTYTGLVGGVDEVGRGPWAGPVYAAAAIFLDPPSLPSFFLKEIKDSKKLTKAKRELIFQHLMEFPSFHYGIGMASVEEIDRLNILKAIFLAMDRAVQALPQKPDVLLVDGKYIPSFKDIPSIPVIGGDSLSLSIAAASIIAKVTRDQVMEKLAKDHPHYGWESNAGYGTAEHQAGLKAYGVTPHHRRSYAPIKKMLGLLE